MQACRECGAGAPLDAHFCPQCRKILPLGRRAPDYFAFLGLRRTLNVGAADLEQRFRALSRQFHPDYFYNATPAERRASLERSSYLNDAYRTLKSPIARVEYLLGLEGLATTTGGDGGTPGPESKQVVPPALLEEVFARCRSTSKDSRRRQAGASPAQSRNRLCRPRCSKRCSP